MKSFDLCRQTFWAALVGSLACALACGNGTVTTNQTGGGSSAGSSGTTAASSAGTSGGTGSHSSSTHGTTSAGTGGSTSGGASSGSTGAGGSSTGGIPTCLGDGGFDCSAFGEICNPSNGMCVGCFQTSDCAGNVGNPVCDTSTDTCVQCLVATDCPYSIPGCMTATDTCGGCVLDSDCPANDTCTNGYCTCTGNSGCGGDAPVCIVTSGTGSCGCSSNNQCPSPDYCSTGGGFSQNGVCVPPCTTDAGACPSMGSAVFCNATTGACEVCTTDAQCVDAGLGPICVQNVGCGTCQVDSDCKDAGTPYCNFSMCVQCETAQQCPANAPGCNFTTNTCGSCSLNSDCPSWQGCNNMVCEPICTGTETVGACAACVFDSDCDAGTCNTNTGDCQ